MQKWINTARSQKLHDYQSTVNKSHDAMILVEKKHQHWPCIDLRYTSAMFPLLTQALAWLSRVCGFDTVDSFPPGSVYARTSWNAAYFDIASDLKPEQIERSICERIANTPAIFAHIVSPTPRMQRALLEVIETRMRRSCGTPNDLVALLVNAYRSPHTLEAVPGLRSVIVNSDGDLNAVIGFLGAMPAAFDIIEA
jgi:hypothetical protein